MKRQFKGRRAPRGMTLIEIMVVLVILGLIAGAVTVAVIPRINEARVSTAKLDISNLENALKLYYARTGRFPDTATGFKILLDQQLIERAPKDPWGNDYVYLLENGRPVITSYGADGAPGGDGVNADITNRPQATATTK